MTRRRVTMIVLFVVLLAGGSACAARGSFTWSGEAFGAFYCAGEAVAAGKNPYLVEPLRSCEHRVWQPAPIPRDVVEPAPLPGYALAPFVLFAMLPYHFAAWLFVALSLAALLISGLLLAEMTGLSLVVTFAALALLGYINIFFGEIPPLAIGFLCIAAACVLARRDRLAAAACAAAMIEPHIALAAALSLFVWRPRARGPLVIAACTCALLSALVLGPSVALSYVTHVVPLHARAEINAADQYSLTWLAHFFGASDTQALALGTCSYVALLILGVFLAPRAAAAFGADALIIFFPVAATTLFGSFIHDLQLSAAMPAALTIAGALGARSILAWVPVFVLSVSWQSWWMTRPMELFGGLVLTAVAARKPSAASIARRSLGIIALLFVFHAAQVLVTHLPRIAVFTLAPSVWSAPRGIASDASASLNWGAYVHEVSRSLDGSPMLLVPKGIVWGTLLLLIAQGALPAVRWDQKH